MALSHFGAGGLRLETTRPLMFSFNFVVRLCSVHGVAGGLGGDDSSSPAAARRCSERPNRERVLPGPSPHRRGLTTTMSGGLDEAMKMTLTSFTRRLRAVCGPSLLANALVSRVPPAT